MRDALAGLVAKSMLVIDEGDADTTRYRLLETLREYAADRLDEARHERPVAPSSRVPLRRPRAATIGPGLGGPDELHWRARVRADADNLRAAVTWSLDAHDPPTAGTPSPSSPRSAYESNGGVDLPISEWAGGPSTPPRRSHRGGGSPCSPRQRGARSAAATSTARGTSRRSALRDGIPPTPPPVLPHQA